MSTVSPKKISSNHVYDYVIVGGGLSGLLVASEMSRHTENFAILEAGETFGGFQKSATSARLSEGEVVTNNGLRFYPSSEISRRALFFLENLLGTAVFESEETRPPMIYDAGHFKPFVGFGEKSPEFYSEIQYFLNPQRVHLKLQPFEWAQQLFQMVKGEFHPRSIVTKFIAEEGAVKGVVVNGSRKVLAQNVIYCGSSTGIIGLLPEGVVVTKTRGKAAKSRHWSAVCLDIVLKQPIHETPEIFLLDGTTNDEVGPCVGAFNGPVSQWISFVDGDEARDEEMIATCLKKMQRQIKRAFPKITEATQYERILIVPDYAGTGDIKLTESLQIPKLSHLYIGSAAFSANKNLVGALTQAEKVLAALGFGISRQALAQDLEPEIVP